MDWGEIVACPAGYYKFSHKHIKPTHTGNLLIDAHNMTHLSGFLIFPNSDRTPLCFHRPTHPTETTLGVLLFLDSVGEATLDIFEQLDDTGTDLDGAITALLNKFKESQNRLFNIHKFRCTIQGKDETWDLFIAKLKAEGEYCDFPAVSWIQRY